MMMQRLELRSALVFLPIAWLPWPAPVDIKGRGTSVLIPDEDLAPERDAARIGHEQIAIAEHVPLRLGDVRLWIQPVGSCRRYVPKCAALDNEIDLAHLLLTEIT